MVQAECRFGTQERAKEAATIVNDRILSEIKFLVDQQGLTFATAFSTLSDEKQDIYLNAQFVLAQKQ